MRNKSFIFKINQLVKKSKYSVAEIALKAGISEDQLRGYMNNRIISFERYLALIEAFVKLEEIELAEQLLRQFTGNDWCFYYTGKDKTIEFNSFEITRNLSILLGNITKIVEKISGLDRYEKMHTLIEIQHMISLLLDLMRLIDEEGVFLRLWK